MDMSQIMEQAQQFQKRMNDVQEEIGARLITSTVGGGMVSATVNGKHDLVSLKIDKEVIDPNDPEMLQDLVISAVNDAIEQARNLSKGEMSKLTGGINFPGLSNLFG